VTSPQAIRGIENVHFLFADDAGERPFECAGAACAHLDHHAQIVFARDDVDLEMTEMKIAPENVEAALLEKASDRFFRQISDALSRRRFSGR
jgi:hypothetical protein